MRHRLRARSSRCSPTRGSRPLPTWRPTSTSTPRDLRRIVSARRRRRAARLRGHGRDRADGGAGRRRAARAAHRAGRRIRRGADARRRLHLPPALGRRRDALGGGRWSPRRSCFWAATTSMLGVSRHIYTLAINRQIPSWLGKLGRPPRDAARRDRDLAALIAIGLVAPDQRQAAGRHLRLRRDARDHDRPPLDPAAAGHRARPRAALHGALEHPLARRAAAGAGALRGAAQRPRLPQRARLSRHARAGSAAAGWLFGLVFYVVYRKVFEGTSLTKRVSVTERGADQAGARGRLRQHPGAGLRHQARRRHRLHRRPPRRRRAGGGRRAGETPRSRSST